jgi:hypothetical protein
MNGASRPCVICHSGQCQGRTPIPLPVSTLPPSVNNPMWWPNDSDWLYVACPECRHVYAYIQPTAVHFPEGQVISHSDKLWLRISFLCGHASCGVPAQFHALVDATVTDTTQSEWCDLLTKGYWIGSCPCGHPLATIAGQKVLFEFSPGKITGL